LIFPPINNPKKILDCGYGSASWAIEVAEKYPDSKVIGIDISPHMKPDETPENLWLQVDDLNQPFNFRSNQFDLVHSRLMAGGIDRERWPTYIQDMVKVLKPGGWLQMVEIYYNCQSDNGTLTEGSALRQWSSRYMSSLDRLKDVRAPLRLVNRMTEAGLVEIENNVLPLPLSGWSSDDAEKRRLGEMNQPNVNALLGSLSLYPFTEFLGMPIEQWLVLIAHARREAENPAFKAYFPLYICIGRKPGGR